MKHFITPIGRCIFIRETKHERSDRYFTWFLKLGAVWMVCEVGYAVLTGHLPL